MIVLLSPYVFDQDTDAWVPAAFLEGLASGFGVQASLPPQMPPSPNIAFLHARAEVPDFAGDNRFHALELHPDNAEMASQEHVKVREYLADHGFSVEAVDEMVGSIVASRSRGQVIGELRDRLPGRQRVS